MDRLRNKVAVVTGAARGIGLDYAERLASLGANIAICDLNLESAQQYKLERERLLDGSLTKTLGRFGGDVYVEQVDVSQPAAVKSFIDAVHGKWGRMDVVVCNAGGGADPHGSEPSQLKPENIATTLNRNLFSTMYTCQSAAQYMKSQRSGKFITIASLAAIQAGAGGRAADYAVAKAGVAHYTRLLAQEMAPYGVTANAIAPGLIATGQWQARFASDDQAALQRFASQVPMGRLGTSADCANVVEFLATSLSDYVTGQVIAVDGGISRAPC